MEGRRFDIESGVRERLVRREDGHGDAPGVISRVTGSTAGAAGERPGGLTWPR
ncbi:MAG: hypothetical protein BIP78_0972 [Candidatus Bipolaricaulis sibiricus]|uniref:Uncharacterized protein n=1 Tax=Bipolaricaulis sibiricus TaxID=2501609 RepID=A0A410FUW4_BIPS1|nr:MAG: hypothetical protein BIP78_0972 [Candidatus Bipolaricaulis sibiricus]